MSLRIKKLSSIILAVLIVALFFIAGETNHSGINAAGRIPIQHNGRIKSLEAFSRETLRLISGKEKWDGQPAIQIVFAHLADPQEFLDVPFIRIDHLELKKTLGVSVERKYFSFKELKPAFGTVTMLVHNAQQKRGSKERLSPLDQQIETLYSRLTAVGNLSSGESLLVIPSPSSEAWHSPHFIRGPLAGAFEDMLEASTSGQADLFEQKVRAWLEGIASSSTDVNAGRLRLEIQYYRIQPFLKAWIFYLTAFLVLLFLSRRAWFRWAGEMFIATGFLFHTLGFFLRMGVLQRPPVSNMYESMIFASWIVMLCVAILFWRAKNTHFLTTGAVVGALIMIYADILPIDSSLDVLVPVLRSNFWLTLHVITIMISYGIFGLAMALGHRQLFLSAVGKLPPQAQGASAAVIYRLLQAGLIFLGAGTVLGGVWANESWGRFWGWDPKETWALITFLGYAAVIHLKYAGKLRPFGVALSSVLGFLLVVMTWYGVNFILGQGLHSYGAGAGGVQWMAGYLVFEIFFLAFVFARRFFLKNPA